MYNSNALQSQGCRKPQAAKQARTASRAQCEVQSVKPSISSISSSQQYQQQEVPFFEAPTRSARQAPASRSKNSSKAQIQPRSRASNPQVAGYDSPPADAYPHLPAHHTPVVNHDKALLSDYKNDFEDKTLDLGVDGAFSEFSVLFLGFWTAERTLPKALEKKGFKVTWCQNDSRGFLDHLKASNEGTTKRFDVVGFMSRTNEPLAEEFQKLVVEAHKLGCGLFIFADNQPLTYHANLVLPTIAGCIVTGDDHADQVLIYGDDPSEPGRFDMKHLVFAGVNSLYEGVTICYPCPVQLPGKEEPEVNRLQTLATSTYDRPAISKIEAVEGEHGRVIVDTGFTKLYPENWGGQERYVVNACVWLTNIEARYGGVEPTASERA